MKVYIPIEMYASGAHFGDVYTSVERALQVCDEVCDKWHGYKRDPYPETPMHREPVIMAEYWLHLSQWRLTNCEDHWVAVRDLHR